MLFNERTCGGENERFCSRVFFEAVNRKHKRYERLTYSCGEHDKRISPFCSFKNSLLIGARFKWSHLNRKYKFL